MTDLRKIGDILTELTRTLESRKRAEAGSSYVASLHAEGLNKWISIYNDLFR